MKLRWRPHTVTSGLWTLFLLAAASLTVFVAALFWSLSLSNDVAASVRQATALETTLRLTGESLLEAESGQRGYLLTGFADYLAPYTAARTQVRQLLADARNLTVAPEAQPNFEYLKMIIAAKLAELQETVDLAQNGKRQAATAIAADDRGRRLMDEFRRIRADVLGKQSQFAEARRETYWSVINGTLWGAVVLGASIVLILFFTARHTAARMRRPIDELLVGIQIVADGDLNHRVAVSSRDEIGRLTEAFNLLAEQALEGRRARDAVHAELERSNSELDSFAYVASHDLKAPLRGIRNLTEWIAEDVGPSASDDTEENLALLRGRVDRLDGLLESLLEYSRVGRGQDAAEPVDTGRLVTEIAEYLAPKPGFTVTCQGPMPTLTTAKPALEKVLRNLIGNALKHHDLDHGTVTVSASDLGTRVVFRVADDGPGIPAEFHEKVFQMFQTLKPRDQIEGSGMGLAIVKKTIESFGGHIRLESNPPERGTTFLFGWPR